MGPRPEPSLNGVVSLGYCDRMRLISTPHSEGASPADFRTSAIRRVVSGACPDCGTLTDA